jgi:hypothetical protein
MFGINKKWQEVENHLVRRASAGQQANLSIQ